MKKKQLLEDYGEDFNKSRGALQEIIEHNRAIANNLTEDLQDGEFNRLEEFIEINKLIMSGVKEMNELFKNAPTVIKTTGDLKEEGEKKSGIDLESLMSEEG